MPAFDSGLDDRSRWDEFTRHADVYQPAYVDGHLLEAGGVADQPARYLDYMHALGRAGGRITEKYLAITAPDPATESA